MTGTGLVTFVTEVDRLQSLLKTAEKHPNPIVRLNLSDAADIARSHATLPVVATGEVSR